MSTTPYYLVSKAYTNTFNYGTNVKNMVNTMLSMDSMLSVAEVIEDTTSQYNVRLRIAQSNVGVQIYNANVSGIGASYMIYSGVWDSSGVWHNGQYSHAYESNKESYQTCVVAWGIGDCYRYIGVGSTARNGFCGFVYNTFTSPGISGICYAVSTFSGTPSNFQAAPIFTGNPEYVYNPKSDAIESITYGSYTPGSTLQKSEYEYALCPKCYQGYTRNIGFPNIRYGGSHKLYALYNGTTAVTAQPGKIVTIDGKSVMSVGQVIYAE